MNRLNIALVGALLACALATVTSTNMARNLFIELDRSQAEQKRINVEWGQLQLEQSTFAKHALIERMATRQLGMHAPGARNLQFVAPAHKPGARP